MEHPYKEYETSELWQPIRSSVEDLIENNDIELFTPIEYVVGYLCKKLSSPHISEEEQPEKNKYLNGVFYSHLKTLQEYDGPSITVY